MPAPFDPNYQDPIVAMQARAAAMKNDPQILLHLANLGDPSAFLNASDAGGQYGANVTPAKPVDQYPNLNATNIGAILAGATNLGGPRPAAPAVVNPGAAPHLGAAALAKAPNYLQPIQQPQYPIGRLLIGR